MTDTRQNILEQAAKWGCLNASQFGDLAESIGACSKRQAINYYNGTSDLTGKRLDVLIDYFRLEAK